MTQTKTLVPISSQPRGQDSFDYIYNSLVSALKETRPSNFDDFGPLGDEFLRRVDLAIAFDPNQSSINTYKTTRVIAGLMRRAHNAEERLITNGLIEIAEEHAPQLHILRATENAHTKLVRVIAESETPDMNALVKVGLSRERLYNLYAIRSI